MPAPASLPRRVRTLGVVLAAGLALVIAGCGEETAPDSVPAAGSADAGATTSGLPAGCQPAPALPKPAPTVSGLPEDEIAGIWDVTVETNCGPITLELDADAAPTTVRSFVHLAESGYWVDSPCHRLTTSGIWVLQCGDPSGTGRGGPGYTFGIENAPEDGQYPRGTLAMARAQDPDSNGGQFFIVYDDTMLGTETGGYSTFGRVVDGMDIIDTVANSGVGSGGTDGPPALPISILDVTVEARGT